MRVNLPFRTDLRISRVAKINGSTRHHNIHGERTCTLQCLPLAWKDLQRFCCCTETLQTVIPELPLQISRHFQNDKKSIILTPVCADCVISNFLTCKSNITMCVYMADQTKNCVMQKDHDSVNYGCRLGSNSCGSGTQADPMVMVMTQVLQVYMQLARNHPAAAQGARSSRLLCRRNAEGKEFQEVGEGNRTNTKVEPSRKGQFCNWLGSCPVAVIVELMPVLFSSMPSLGVPTTRRGEERRLWTAMMWDTTWDTTWAKMALEPKWPLALEPTRRHDIPVAIPSLPSGSGPTPTCLQPLRQHFLPPRRCLHLSSLRHLS